MKRKRQPVTIQELKENFHYDPISGTLFRKYQRVTGKVEYVPMGHQHSPSGHLRVSYKFHLFYYHRLAWMLATGDWPTEDIDHANQDPSDNRLCNLRLAGKCGNYQNRPAFKTDFKFFSKYKGVGMNGGKWIARIQYIDNDITHRLSLGRFATEAEAAHAYNEAAKQYHGEFAYLNDIKETQ